MANDPEVFLVPQLVGLAVVGIDQTPPGDNVFLLSNGGTIVSGGLWRLLANGAIVATELDLGLTHWDPDAPPMAVQVEKQMREHLFEHVILDARVLVPTGDLVIRLSGDVTLQFIKLHSFLESWQMTCSGLHVLVNAWGEVSLWASPADGNA